MSIYGRSPRADIRDPREEAPRAEQTHHYVLTHRAVGEAGPRRLLPRVGDRVLDRQPLRHRQAEPGDLSDGRYLSS
jgi:hypothetical protein